MATFGTIPRVSEGQPVSASAMNRLIDIVNLLRSSRGGQELREVVPGRVVRIYGNPIEDLIGNVRYDFEATGIGVTLTNRAPDYGRPLRQPDIRIRPAVMGARCFIHRFINEAGEMDYKVELPFGGEGECLSPSRCGNAPLRPMMRVLMNGAAGDPVDPAPDPGPDPSPGDGGSPVGGGVVGL